ncbi:MAG: RDD family protein [Acidobacteriota bacterium]
MELPPHQQARIDVEADVSDLLGVDNVPLALPIAGMGSRLLAASIDYLLLLLVITLVILIATATMNAGLVPVDWFWPVFGLLLFLLQWGYFLGLEVTMEGQTPGKLMLGIRTVGDQGGKAGMGSLVVRNLIRVVDVLVAVPLFFIDRQARRLGDHLAGTLVIHERLEHEDSVSLGRIPAGWSAREVAVAESVLARVPHLLPERAEWLAGLMLERLRRDDPDAQPLPDEPAPVALARLLDARRRVW